MASSSAGPARLTSALLRAVQPLFDMKTSLPRAVFALWVLIGLTVGCISRNTSREPPGTPMVTANDVDENPVESIEKLLQTKAPGLLVTRTADGGIAVQIRGPSSFYGSNEPLYVIDDVLFEPGSGGALTGLNPHDIESIKVLKNPADTGVYGIRGANGVIIITTKKPGKRSR
jgi:TonB-dependent SusC/RagA subfamily outer membrane receptor